MRCNRNYHFADGKELHLGGKTCIMGILNVTPDSFSDGGQWNTVAKAKQHLLQMVDEGADIIDIGAESTRPGSMPLTAEEEQARLLPYLRELVPISPVPLSVDTYHASTARLAAACGVHMLNDVWGLQYAGEPAGTMAAVAAETGLPLIVMHNQQGQQYDGDVISIMQAFFRRSLHIAAQAGVKRENIILDPGIGFGKDTPTNLLVQRRLWELTVIDGEAYPLLLACSRKRFIGDVLGLPSDERDLATGAAGVVGILNDACMLRVHAVEPMAQMAAITDAIRGVAVDADAR